ncbi:N-acetylmuramoyl-L-alanine amidase [Hyperolius riggenbachi]|uniref:N-acetylmuramoyl-L-alanine amidase n=1 Tax=Hyperolius riggenbachi TaxID=752182 RepID=UPI0035A29DF9
MTIWQWHWICIFIFPVCRSATPPPVLDPVVMKMDTFIGLVHELESSLPGSSAEDLAKLLLSSVSAPPQSPKPLSDKQAALARILLPHKVVGLDEKRWQEQGVVLAPDGSTVALMSLLQSVIWGWEADCDGENIEKNKKPDNTAAGQETSDQSTHQITLPGLLGLGFSKHKGSSQVTLEAPDGCWDSISKPQSFQLLGAPFNHDLTLANINGVLDGALLKEVLTNETKKMSDLLQSYYGGKSPYRRQNFQGLLREGQLEAAIQKAIQCHRKYTTESGIPHLTDEELSTIAAIAAKTFEQKYLDCPAVIPRCMWEAKPYKGTPTLLQLPLQNVYIHHTYQPSKPCMSFKDCSANMRGMQNFHQIDRGWDDIGYSFVVGSDGYLYEGRGWLWVGAHTRGHNLVGYGVSFIGDFTSSIPESPILSLVRDRFLRCASRSGYITANYTIQGHRQVVNTLCPGDALFQEITTWENFKES